MKRLFALLATATVMSLAVIVAGTMAPAPTQARERAIDPTPHSNAVTVCYLFDPRLDDPLDGSIFDPPGWRQKQIPRSALESYTKNRAGLYVMDLEQGDRCPRYVLMIPQVSR